MPEVLSHLTHFLPGLLQMLPLALEFLEEIRAIAGKLDLADTRYLEHLVLRLGMAADHGTKRRIGEDHVGRDMALVCKALPQGAQPLEHLFCIVSRLVEGRD